MDGRWQSRWTLTDHEIMRANPSQLALIQPSPKISLMTLCDPTAAHRGHVPVSTSSWCAPERRNYDMRHTTMFGHPRALTEREELSELSSYRPDRRGPSQGPCPISMSLPRGSTEYRGRQSGSSTMSPESPSIGINQRTGGLTSPWWLTQSRAEVKGSVTRQERKDRVGLEVGVGWIGDRTKSGGECGSQPLGVRSAATPKKTVVILQAWWRSLLGQVNFIQGHVTRGTPKKANTSRATVSSLYHFGFYQISKWFLAVSHIWSSWPACLSARLSLSLHTAQQPVRSVQNKVKEGNAVKKLPLTNKSHCWVKRHTFCWRFCHISLQMWA